MKKYLNGRNITVGIITLILGILAVTAIARGLMFAQTTVSGTVVVFMLNPEGKVEGAILNTGDQVRFGLQTGELVSSQVKIGDSLSATGRAGSRSSYGRELNAESLQIGEQTITVIKGAPKPLHDRPHPPHDRKPKPGDERHEPNGASNPEPNADIPLAREVAPASKETVKAGGKVQFVIVGARGEARGLVLASGEQLRLPREVVNTGIAIDENTDVTVEGEASKSNFGTFVNPVHLTIGNQTFSFNR